MNNKDLPIENPEMAPKPISKPRIILEIAGAFLIASLGFSYIDSSGQALMAQTEAPTTLQLLGKVASTALVIGGIILVMTYLLRQSGSSWSSLGLKKHSLKSNASNFIVLLVGFVLVGAIGQYVTQFVGTPPDVSKFSFLEGNLPFLIAGIASVFISSGFGEEMIYRGFILNRFIQLFDTLKNPEIMALITQSIIFGLVHMYQGLSGVILTGIAGLLFGIVYLKMGRNLTILIIFHGLVNTLNFIAFYFGAI